MRTAMSRSVLAGTIALLLWSVGIASAQTPNEDVLKERTHAIAAKLRCPVCQGQALADSQSELSQQMRGVITEQLREGKTDAQVIDYFVAKYGEWILLEPKARGFNLIAYFLPLIMLAAGIGVIYMSVRKWTRAAGSEASSAVA
jgi:cytochrome c-type biogenesis protein CcmH